ncbi:hypothetical protein [Campylobacter canadensis]|uniref:hypothetical protein n=3 Tax=Campylobacter canadensis TaxID=449520 RepID=UPI0015546246|nr:hypothetical protein [Campylobacter canadensis]
MISIAIAKNITGKVLCLSNNKEKILQENDLINLGDIITTTDTNSGLDVFLKNGTTIHIGGENKVKIDDKILNEVFIDEKIKNLLNNDYLEATNAGENSVATSLFLNKNTYSNIEKEQLKVNADVEKITNILNTQKHNEQQDIKLNYAKLSTFINAINDINKEDGLQNTESSENTESNESSENNGNSENTGNTESNESSENIENNKDNNNKQDDNNANDNKENNENPIIDKSSEYIFESNGILITNKITDKTSDLSPSFVFDKEVKSILLFDVTNNKFINDYFYNQSSTIQDNKFIFELSKNLMPNNEYKVQVAFKDGSFYEKNFSTDNVKVNDNFLSDNEIYKAFYSDENVSKTYSSNPNDKYLKAFVESCVKTNDSSYLQVNIISNKIPANNCSVIIKDETGKEYIYSLGKNDFSKNGTFNKNTILLNLKDEHNYKIKIVYNEKVGDKIIASDWTELTNLNANKISSEINYSEAINIDEVENHQLVFNKNQNDLRIDFKQIHEFSDESGRNLIIDGVLKDNIELYLCDEKFLNKLQVNKTNNFRLELDYTNYNDYLKLYDTQSNKIIYYKVSDIFEHKNSIMNNIVFEDAKDGLLSPVGINIQDTSPKFKFEKEINSFKIYEIINGKKIDLNIDDLSFVRSNENKAGGIYSIDNFNPLHKGEYIISVNYKDNSNYEQKFSIDYPIRNKVDTPSDINYKATNINLNAEEFFTKDNFSLIKQEENIKFAFNANKAGKITNIYLQEQDFIKASFVKDNDIWHLNINSKDILDNTQNYKISIVYENNFVYNLNLSKNFINNIINISDNENKISLADESILENYELKNSSPTFKFYGKVNDFSIFDNTENKIIQINNEEFIKNSKDAQFNIYNFANELEKGHKYTIYASFNDGKISSYEFSISLNAKASILNDFEKLLNKNDILDIEKMLFDNNTSNSKNISYENNISDVKLISIEDNEHLHQYS